MKRILVFTVLSFVIGGVIYSCKHEPEPIPLPPVEPVCFQEEVLPIFRSNCAMSGCHSAQSAQDGIILDNYFNILSSGVVPFNPNESEVYEVLLEQDPDDRMPLAPAPPLSSAQIGIIYAWIAQGARNDSCATECDTVNVTYSNQVTKVLNGNCMGCHRGPSPSGNVNLDGYTNLKTWVDNGKLSLSVNQQNGATPMPYLSPRMNDCNVRTIQIWIDNGALNN
jgi:hypothetical protein